MTFLDLTVRQIEVRNLHNSFQLIRIYQQAFLQYLNDKYKVQVPLILMNSFNTDEDTERIIQKYKGHGLQIITFNQSRFPRVSKESLLPIAKSPDAPIGCWYPPGHGDLFEALMNSGTLDELIAQGKEYLFVSNVDNLGATVDISEWSFW